MEYLNIIKNCVKVRSEKMGKEREGNQACMNNIPNDAGIT